MSKEKKLTDKQEAFCQEYLIDLNATQAAIRAGYSEKTAASMGQQNLIKLEITKRLHELKAKRSEKTQIDANYVLNRLAEIDSMDVADILESDGSVKPINEWPKVWRQTVSGVDVSSDGEVILKKVKWPDKVKNLELLGKHVGVQAFQEKTKSEVTVTHEEFLSNLK